MKRRPCWPAMRSQSLAFEVLANDPALTISAAQRLRMLTLLAQAAAWHGRAEQAIDLASGGKALALAQLEDMHLRKTGALIRAAVLLARTPVKTWGQRISRPSRNTATPSAWPSRSPMTFWTWKVTRRRWGKIPALTVPVANPHILYCWASRGENAGQGARGPPGPRKSHVFHGG